MTTEELYHRRIQLNKTFDWSSENIKKILSFNDTVLLKYVEAWEKTDLVIKDLLKLQTQGTSIYDNFRIEAEILYCPEDEIETADYNTLCDLSENQPYSGNIIVVEYDKSQKKFTIPFKTLDKYFLSDLNWNIEIFNRPEFEKKKISYFLHNMFCDGVYSLQDLVFMNPEDVKVFIKVELE